MRRLHYVEIEHFKGFGERQRIELDHPAVLIGPNNCGKTTVIQAIALWSQAVKTWFDAKGRSPPKERTATSLNRLNIVSVPVPRTRYFWHNTVVRSGNRNISLLITVGFQHGNEVVPVTMSFRNQGDELVYCTPDAETLAKPEVVEAAAKLDVELLYPMSGLETEEPILQPGRIDVLLGQGQTAQVLRNLCLLVSKSTPEDWQEIQRLMERLFDVRLGKPTETARGSIDLLYRQRQVKEALDVSLAGRGLQQMLLIFAYLYSHRGSVLLIDEPDAHLEILRQKQVYVLLEDIARRNGSQVILVTHSEVILDEALDRNLTLLMGGRADDLAAKKEIRDSLTLYGAEHYVRARERGYVLYVEGSTDIAILKALARHLGHPVAEHWDERINTYYLQSNFPDAAPGTDAELERVEGGFGIKPKEHFFALRHMIPDLRGLAILDSDRGVREDVEEGGLNIVHWRRYEVENYFVTPEVLCEFVTEHYRELPLFGGHRAECEAVLDGLILERVFARQERDMETWKSLPGDAARLLWEARTERVKLSDFAEEFFRRLAETLRHPMLLRKGELHQLVTFADPDQVSAEVREKLDLLETLFVNALPGEGE